MHLNDCIDCEKIYEVGKINNSACSQTKCLWINDGRTDSLGLQQSSVQKMSVETVNAQKIKELLLALGEGEASGERQPRKLLVSGCS